MTRNTLKLALSLIAVIATASQASAYSLGVKLACRSDYYANCSQHALSSPGVRQCMRAVGTRLTPGCIDALVGAGEVTRAEVNRRSSTASR